MTSEGCNGLREEMKKMYVAKSRKEVRGRAGGVLHPGRDKKKSL